MPPQGEVSADRSYQTSHVRSTAVPSLAYNPAEAKPFLSTPPSLSGEGPCLDISLTVEFSAEKTWRPAASAFETRVVTLAGRQEISAENSRGGLNKIRDRLLTILRHQKLLRTPGCPVVWMQKFSCGKLQIFALRAVPDNNQLIRVGESVRWLTGVKTSQLRSTLVPN